METFISKSLQKIGEISSPLTASLEELFAKIEDSDLLIERECSDEKPTLLSLGEKYGLTGERIRQRLVKAKLSLDGLVADGNVPTIVEEALALMWSDFGLAVPLEDSVYKRWQAELGVRSFEMLRFLSSYIYREGSLVYGKTGLSDLKDKIGVATKNEWQVSSKKLPSLVDVPLREEVAQHILEKSNLWRNVGNGKFVSYKTTLLQKAQEVLYDVGKPMSPNEIVKQIGYGTSESLKNYLIERSTPVMRIDKNFNLALRAWDFKEYRGILFEIYRRIDEGSGKASISAIVKEFVNDYGVKKDSVLQYLRSDLFENTGDEVRRKDTSTYIPKEVSDKPYSVRVGKRWGQIFTVSNDNMRGYSFRLNRDIAFHNGIKPNDSLVVPVEYDGRTIGQASLIWRASNLTLSVDIGRLRPVLEKIGVAEGDKIILVPTNTSCKIIYPCDS